MTSFAFRLRVLFAVLCLGGLACPRPTPALPAGGNWIDARIQARCYTQDWRGPAMFKSSGAPFSVLVGARNQWAWAGSSVDGQLDVPLARLAGTGRVEVVFVTGAASKHDRIQTSDDDALNRALSRGVQGKFEIEPGRWVPNMDCLKPGDNHDGCISPQCPRPNNQGDLQ